MARLDEFIQRSKKLSKSALAGCKPEIYEDMSALLADIVTALKNLSDPRLLEMLNGIIRELLTAQEACDLYRISDDLGYELPYVLQEISAHTESEQK